MLWGGFARIFALDHATWAVNSLGHTIGNREFPLRDDSRNIGALAPPTMGGSWHNNHHAGRPCADPPTLVAARPGRRLHPDSSIGSDWRATFGTSIRRRIMQEQSMNVETHDATVVSDGQRGIARPGDRAAQPEKRRAKRVVALVTIGVPAIGFAVARVPDRHRQGDRARLRALRGVLRDPDVRHHHRVPSIRRAQVVQDVAILRGRADDHRVDGAGGSAHVLGEHAPPTPPVRRRTGRPAFTQSQRRRPRRQAERPLVSPTFRGCSATRSRG